MAPLTTQFSTEVPTFWNDNQLTALLQSHGVLINASSPTQGTSLVASLLFGFGPTLLLVGLFIAITRRAARGGVGGALGNFGRSRARRIDPATIRITFADVAGIDEAKAELTEIVDFLRDPERYGRLGGRMPHGVLLSGAPGTGKTLLARAVAGEAHAAFFSISASEFIEAIVGVGASRVRDLFAKAKEAAPAIIFIDELDAIGRSRQGSISINGGNDEREQTLDQILTEMDGFESVEAVVVLAATNRPEILDPALLRPGRFDRRVSGPAPRPRRADARSSTSTRARFPWPTPSTLTRWPPARPGWSERTSRTWPTRRRCSPRAASTSGWSGPTSPTRSRRSCSARRAGSCSRRSTASGPPTTRPGHALVGMLTPGADPVRKVSIIPRGMALGVTLSAPDDDQVSYTLEDLLAKLRVAVAGRVAEELVYGTITTGAESDIQQLTAIARQMVGRWGMSETVGLVAVLPLDGRGPLLPGASETSQATQQLVDDEVRRLIDDAHRHVTELLSAHRPQLDALTQRAARGRDTRRHRRLPGGRPAARGG